MKKELSYYNTQYGITCCNNWNISYFLFSDVDFNFYKDDKRIEIFDVEEIKSFKTGFELFCIKEYNLIPFINDNNILTKKEYSNLLIKLKELFSDIKELKINYKINGKINLLTATPENFGILSLNNEIKVFTYFDGNSMFLLLKKKIHRNLIILIKYIIINLKMMNH